MSNLYKVLLNRENLDALMLQLSHAHQIEIVVDPYDNISFNVHKDSDINIKELDIITEIHVEIDKLKKKSNRLKTNGKRKQELDNTIQGLETASEIIEKLLEKV